MNRRPNMNPKNTQRAQQGARQGQQQQQRSGSNQQQRAGNQQQTAGTANQQQRANVRNQQQRTGSTGTAATANQQQKAATPAPAAVNQQASAAPAPTAATTSATASNNQQQQPQPLQQQQQEQNVATTKDVPQSTLTVAPVQAQIPASTATVAPPATTTPTPATPTHVTTSATVLNIPAAAGAKKSPAEKKEDLAKQLNSLFGAHPSEMPVQDGPTTSAMSMEKRISTRNRLNFLLRLYVFAILFSCHAVAQFILLHYIHESHTGKCYVGLAWLLLSIVLFALYINFDELRFGFPANWVISVLIMLSLTYSLAMVAIVDRPLHVLWTSLWTFTALPCLICLGAIRPPSISPTMWIIIMTTVFANVGIFGLMIMFWLWQIEVDGHAFRFAVLFCVFPIAMYHSQNIHGHYKNGMPLDDLPLCVMLLFFDFLIIYVGMFWADGFSAAINEMYQERMHESRLQKAATTPAF